MVQYLLPDSILAESMFKPILESPLASALAVTSSDRGKTLSDEEKYRFDSLW